MEEFFEFWSFTLCREHNVEAQTSKSTQMKIKKENSKLHEKKKRKRKEKATFLHLMQMLSQKGKEDHCEL